MIEGKQVITGGKTITSQKSADEIASNLVDNQEFESVARRLRLGGGRSVVLLLAADVAFYLLIGAVLPLMPIHAIFA